MVEEFKEELDISVFENNIHQIRKKKNIGIHQLKLMYKTGEELYNSYQLKEAETLFQAYTVLNPYDHRGPGCLASIYLEQGRYKQALDTLKILRSFPTCHLDEVFINISLCHYKLEQHDDAVSVLMVVKKDTLNTFYQTRYDYLKSQLNPYLSGACFLA
ncbi:regulator [Vibrio aquaticus]|uniref:Regulator n=2 Tax=Vibrio aquaticus TaxID=2496559 RepID=A0A3S0PQD7_9VIBR|nr:regulator [Vibrio aquaticus]